MRSFLVALTRDWLGLVGAALTTATAVLFLILYGIHLVGMHGAGPYQGIINFLILPALFVLGLLLIPLGLVRERRRERRAAAQGEPPPSFPVIDLNRTSTRKNALIFLALTAVNLVILAIGTYKGVEVMDSTPFCGATCHSVMHPEYTTYRRSPHARVECVACHIGPGADWFVKSKLSGSWQVVSVAFNLYPRPIPAPVHNLRPARETCEQCHWPNKFVGDRLRVITHYAEDEANTPLKTVLVLKVGGQRPGGSHGIHWHVDPSNIIRYRADASREMIYEVEMTHDGAVQRFVGPAASGGEAASAGEWRTMDCVDCHNRPTHIYRLPDEALDLALLEGQLDASLPYIRREGLQVLQQTYASHEAARAGIRDRITAFYRQSYPDVASRRADAVEAAARALGDIYCGNVFPAMNVQWGTYRNHIGHMRGPGCFRCHDEEHTTSDGKSISQDCSTCHSVLADGEKDPEVLRTLLD